MRRTHPWSCTLIKYIPNKMYISTQICKKNKLEIVHDKKILHMPSKLLQVEKKVTLV